MSERLFVVTLHRRMPGSKDLRMVWTRRFARLHTAIRRIGELATLEGLPGDLYELAHAGTGRQLGTARLTIKDRNMRLVTEWS